MMTVESQTHAPTIEEAARVLGVGLSDLDEEFGVIAIDPDKGTYTVRVFADAIPKLKRTSDRKFAGPFSDPKIAPFGTPRK